MKFKIPFTFSNTEILRKKSKSFSFIKAGKNSFKSLEQHLKNADVSINKQEYVRICVKIFFITFILLFAVLGIGFWFFNIKLYLSAIVAVLISLFVFMRQINYPKIYTLAKEREIERNLIPALQDMYIQLSSGIPVFRILVNISDSDYGSVSEEFGKAVREINAGKPQTEAIDELGKRNTSVYFRRILWQISNGMRAGSDMSSIIKEEVNNLGKEQMIQIQGYGSRLNPLVMFYMIGGIILPALGITFFTIISSILNFGGTVIKLLFVGVFVFVILIQIMILGLMRMRRPSLI